MATGLKALRLRACGVMIVMLRRMKVAEMAKYGRDFCMHRGGIGDDRDEVWGTEDAAVDGIAV
ncbi:hypothetical protein M378DRAFT_19275 [Amanita muscaria Koide BX008]|uniref:Uncharacterized protein n=1 Tax=Amanita muscaria (strain Koide BX008) TaxID=946122 RepID=A0A0C2VYY7_AMAMK|nr:hypothetical protein M378DRAFT_19275 [Amanita muscaria Koide BX008]